MTCNQAFKVRMVILASYISKIKELLAVFTASSDHILESHLLPIIPAMCWANVDTLSSKLAYLNPSTEYHAYQNCRNTCSRPAGPGYLNLLAAICLTH